MVFSNFPDETQQDDIIAFINEKMKNVEADIYAFAKTANAGAAKFSTEEEMWTYMTNNKGNHTHHFEGRRIYVKAAPGTVNTVDDLREKAVGKVERALIEREGGDGVAVKKIIDARYPWGAVWWQNDNKKWAKVAQWCAQSQKMTLTGCAEDLQQVVDKYLE